MTKTQITGLKTLIETKRRELVSEIHAQTNLIAINESEADPIDQIQSMTMREETASQLGRRSRVLAEIERALHAIYEGTYGFCIDCEEPISLKRLETIPWASRCIGCQQSMERREAEHRMAA
jgi:DnaK suppressor protein